MQYRKAGPSKGDPPTAILGFHANLQAALTDGVNRPGIGNLTLQAAQGILLAVPMVVVPFCVDQPTNGEARSPKNRRRDCRFTYGASPFGEPADLPCTN